MKRKVKFQRVKKAVPKTQSAGRQRPQPTENHACALALDLLSTSGYVPISKRLMNSLGPVTALYLTYLIERYKYYSSNGLMEWIHDSEESPKWVHQLPVANLRTNLNKLGILEFDKQHWRINLAKLIGYMEL